jgi:hypothetical protein
MVSLFVQNLLPATKPVSKNLGQQKKLMAGPLKVVNCSSTTAAEDKFVVRHFNITPQEPGIPIPGSITFEFDIAILTDLGNFMVSYFFPYSENTEDMMVAAFFKLMTRTVDKR